LEFYGNLVLVGVRELNEALDTPHTLSLDIIHKVDVDGCGSVK